MKVIGRQIVNGVSKNTGGQYSGVNLFCTYPLSASKGEGTGCTKVYVSSSANGYDIARGCKLGSELSFSYNQWGKVNMVFDDTDE